MFFLYYFGLFGFYTVFCIFLVCAKLYTVLFIFTLFPLMFLVPQLWEKWAHGFAPKPPTPEIFDLR